jgi:hypothetical protein
MDFNAYQQRYGAATTEPQRKKKKKAKKKKKKKKASSTRKPAEPELQPELVDISGMAANTTLGEASPRATSEADMHSDTELSPSTQPTSAVPEGETPRSTRMEPTEEPVDIAGMVANTLSESPSLHAIKAVSEQLTARPTGRRLSWSSEEEKGEVEVEVEGHHKKVMAKEQQRSTAAAAAAAAAATAVETERLNEPKPQLQLETAAELMRLEPVDVAGTGVHATLGEVSPSLGAIKAVSDRLTKRTTGHWRSASSEEEEGEGEHEGWQEEGEGELRLAGSGTRNAQSAPARQKRVAQPTAAQTQQSEKELHVLLGKATARQIIRDEASTKRIWRHIEEGSYSAEYYVKMWRQRLADDTTASKAAANAAAKAAGTVPNSRKPTLAPELALSPAPAPYLQQPREHDSSRGSRSDLYSPGKGGRVSPNPFDTDRNAADVMRLLLTPGKRLESRQRPRPQPQPQLQPQPQPKLEPQPDERTDELNRSLSELREEVGRMWKLVQQDSVSEWMQQIDMQLSQEKEQEQEQEQGQGQGHEEPPPVAAEVVEYEDEEAEEAIILAELLAELHKLASLASLASLDAKQQEKATAADDEHVARDAAAVVAAAVVAEARAVVVKAKHEAEAVQQAAVEQTIMLERTVADHQQELAALRSELDETRESHRHEMRRGIADALSLSNFDMHQRPSTMRYIDSVGYETGAAAAEAQAVYEYSFAFQRGVGSRLLAVAGEANDESGVAWTRSDLNHDRNSLSIWHDGGDDDGRTAAAVHYTSSPRPDTGSPRPDAGPSYTSSPRRDDESEPSFAKSGCSCSSPTRRARS